MAVGRFDHLACCRPQTVHWWVGDADAARLQGVQGECEVGESRRVG